MFQNEYPVYAIIPHLLGRLGDTAPQDNGGQFDIQALGGLSPCLQGLGRHGMQGALFDFQKNENLFIRGHAHLSFPFH
jgi:hypothetical protein